MLLKAPVMPTSYPNTRLILQKIFGGKLVSRESIGKPMMGSNGVHYWCRAVGTKI
jgi:hypothetical protein